MLFSSIIKDNGKLGERRLHALMAFQIIHDMRLTMTPFNHGLHSSTLIFDSNHYNLHKMFTTLINPYIFVSIIVVYREKNGCSC